MQAIILAAGMGRRLGEFTAENTKCMLPVNGIRLIDRMLTQLSALNLSRIIVVIGYAGANLKSYIEKYYSSLPIQFVENPYYAKTNNIYSLWLTRHYFNEDQETLLLESDLIFEDSVLLQAVNSKYKDCALVSKYETWMDGTMVRIDDDDNIVNFIPKKAFDYADTGHYYKTVNIYKFSRDFLLHHYLPFLEAYIKVLGENEYYEQVLRVITLIDSTGIKAQPITGMYWYEIDDVQDLRIAEAIFADPEQRLVKIQNSYGGYWRYPGLLDYCYLVNPYFPTPRLINEVKANFEPLLRNYPSGMKVNSLLASKYFSVRHEYMVVGNGAAELIKSLMTFMTGRLGLVYPTFEEYPNRYNHDQLVKFVPGNPDFSYGVDDLIGYFTAHPVDNMLLVNPDNPSGNYLPKGEVRRLIDWAEEKHIRLVVDESFIDFADDGRDATLLDNDILEKHKLLCVMKSISKSYGVPGLRLGVLASSDCHFIEMMRKDVGIWNINSFAEFYMQIFGKYEGDFYTSCDKFKAERQHFYKQLSEIEWLRVIPSEANYFLVDVMSKYTSSELTLKLLCSFNILIKDCKNKKGFNGKGQYIRIAIRDRADNDRLIAALKSL